MQMNVNSFGISASPLAVARPRKKGGPRRRCCRRSAAAASAACAALRFPHPRGAPSRGVSATCVHEHGSAKLAGLVTVWTLGAPPVWHGVHGASPFACAPADGAMPCNPASSQRVWYSLHLHPIHHIAVAAQLPSSAWLSLLPTQRRAQQAAAGSIRTPCVFARHACITPAR